MSLNSRENPNEKKLTKKRGKRRSYCFGYNAMLTTSALKALLEEEDVNEKRKSLASQLEGAFVNEATSKLYLFFTKGKELTVLKKYPFVLEETIMKWLPRSRNFDSSIPPNTEEKFLTWDFRSQQRNHKLVQMLENCDLSEDDEMEAKEVNVSKLKKKQARKVKEKTRRSLLSSCDLNENENFSLKMYLRISKGESFNAIFKEIFETGDLITLQRLNRMTNELRQLEKNIEAALGKLNL